MAAGPSQLHGSLSQGSGPKIKRKPVPQFPYTSRYPPPDPEDPFAPLWVLRTRAETQQRGFFSTDSESQESLRLRPHHLRSAKPEPVDKEYFSENDFSQRRLSQLRRRSQSVAVPPSPASRRNSRALSRNSFSDFRMAEMPVLLPPSTSVAPAPSPEPDVGSEPRFLPRLASAAAPSSPPPPPPPMTPDDSSVSGASISSGRRDDQDSDNRLRSISQPMLARPSESEAPKPVPPRAVRISSLSAPRQSIFGPLRQHFRHSSVASDRPPLPTRRSTSPTRRSPSPPPRRSQSPPAQSRPPNRLEMQPPRQRSFSTASLASATSEKLGRLLGVRHSGSRTSVSTSRSSGSGLGDLAYRRAISISGMPKPEPPKPPPVPLVSSSTRSPISIVTSPARVRHESATSRRTLSSPVKADFKSSAPPASPVRAFLVPRPRAQSDDVLSSEGSVQAARHSRVPARHNSSPDSSDVDRPALSAPLSPPPKPVPPPLPQITMASPVSRTQPKPKQDRRVSRVPVAPILIPAVPPVRAASKASMEPAKTLEVEQHVAQPLYLPKVAPLASQQSANLVRQETPVRPPRSVPPNTPVYPKPKPTRMASAATMLSGTTVVESVDSHTPPRPPRLRPSADELRERSSFDALKPSPSVQSRHHLEPVKSSFSAHSRHQLDALKPVPSTQPRRFADAVKASPSVQSRHYLDGVKPSSSVQSRQYPDGIKPSPSVHSRQYLESVKPSASTQSRRPSSPGFVPSPLTPAPLPVPPPPSSYGHAKLKKQADVQRSQTMGPTAMARPQPSTERPPTPRRAATAPPPMPTLAFDEYALPNRERLSEAASLLVIAENGLRIPFGDLWRDRKTVVLFIRHFWCPFDQDYMYSVARHVNDEALAKAGINLVIIGNGSAAMIKSYRQIFRTPFSVYTDPTLRLHETLGMTLRTNDPGPESERAAYVRHGLVGGIALVVINALRVGMPVFEKGGEPTQLGGEFVLGPGLKCTFAHRMSTTRSHTPILGVIAAAGMKPREMSKWTASRQHQQHLDDMHAPRYSPQVSATHSSLRKKPFTISKPIGEVAHDGAMPMPGGMRRMLSADPPAPAPAPATVRADRRLVPEPISDEDDAEWAEKRRESLMRLKERKARRRAGGNASATSAGVGVGAGTPSRGSHESQSRSGTVDGSHSATEYESASEGYGHNGRRWGDARAAPSEGARSGLSEGAARGRAASAPANVAIARGTVRADADAAGPSGESGVDRLKRGSWEVVDKRVSGAVDDRGYGHRTQAQRKPAPAPTQVQSQAPVQAERRRAGASKSRSRSRPGRGRKEVLVAANPPERSEEDLAEIYKRVQAGMGWA